VFVLGELFWYLGDVTAAGCGVRSICAFLVYFLALKCLALIKQLYFILISSDETVLIVTNVSRTDITWFQNYDESPLVSEWIYIPTTNGVTECKRANASTGLNRLTLLQTTFKARPKEIIFQLE